jgi:hypothetical protein
MGGEIGGEIVGDGVGTHGDGVSVLEGGYECGFVC